MKKEKYIINPSELSYICHHCAHLKHNYNLEDRGISAGITGELDSIEKEFFLGDVKKLSKDLPEGKIIDADHLNLAFQSTVLNDNKKRPFRIKGKGDAIIKYKDNSNGIIDYKTSKFKDKKTGKRSKKLDDSVYEYSFQLHCYALLYSNLENDKDFLNETLKNSKPTWGNEAIKKHVNERLKKIKEISINNISSLGLVYVYPQELIDKKSLLINFSFSYEKVEYKPDKFLDFLTGYIDHLEKPIPPAIPDRCKNQKERQHCYMHSFFYDQKKLPKKIG